MIELPLNEIAEIVGGSAVGNAIIRGVCTDSRSVIKGSLFVALVDANDGHDYVDSALDAGCVAVLVSKPSSIKEGVAGVIVDDTLVAMTRLACNWRNRFSGRVVGITGSVGKTTTKNLVCAALSPLGKGTCAVSSFNNHIGVPLTLLSLSLDDEYLVCEIGTNAKGEIAQLSKMVRPDVAVITGAGEVHLEGLGNIDGVVEEKGAIIDSLSENGTLILNDTMYGADAFASRCKCSVYRVGATSSSDLQINKITSTSTGIEFCANGVSSKLKMHGEYNALNAGLALGVAKVFDIETALAVKCIEHIQAADLRMVVEHINGIEWMWDCFNANPVSMRAAIRVLAQKKCSRRGVIFGDMAELGTSGEFQHIEIAKLIADADVAWVIAVGEFAPIVASVAREHGVEFTACVEKVENVIEIVREFALPSDCILVKGSHGIHLENLIPLARMEAD